MDTMVCLDAWLVEEKDYLERFFYRLGRLLGIWQYLPYILASRDLRKLLQTLSYCLGGQRGGVPLLLVANYWG